MHDADVNALAYLSQGWKASKIKFCRIEAKSFEDVWGKAFCSFVWIYLLSQTIPLQQFLAEDSFSVSFYPLSFYFLYALILLSLRCHFTFFVLLFYFLSVVILLSLRSYFTFYPLSFYFLYALSFLSLHCHFTFPQ